MEQQKIKCVVWDLDNTVWDGVLLESDEVVLKENVVGVIKELDRRGILQSISSKNEYESAMEKLKELGLWEYFIYPQINWNAKSSSIEEIRKSVNFGIDTFAFVDDQAFEREEVNFNLPDVLCIDALEVDNILAMDRMNPKFVTNDSKNRRKMYQSDIRRNSDEKDFVGTQEEFLRSLNMNFKIRRAKESDLQRAEELTVRTHQLNSTGYIYSYDELKEFIGNDKYEVFVTELEDKYGTYGTIGIALIEKDETMWELKLLLMSCRVMSKGVGGVLMNYIINKARAEKVGLRAQFVPTNKNRIMYITYKFNGFKEVQTGDLVIFEADMTQERPIPDYVNIIVEG